MNNQQLLRYSRHLLLNEINEENQQKILNAKILVIGCGGLGTAVLPYLAAAGVGNLIIADDDVIEWSNLQRQVCYTEADIGKKKVLTMHNYLSKLNSQCQIQTYDCRLQEQELNQLLPNCDLVIDCSDNFTTRLAINRAAVIARKPLISGAATAFEGQICTYRLDLNNEPCYQCLFGESIAEHNQNCATFGVFSPVIGIIGATQAMDALKILMNLPVQHKILRCFNSLIGNWQTFSFQKNPHCSACA